MLNMIVFLFLVVSIYLGMQYYLAFWVLRNFPSVPVSHNTVLYAVLLLALSFPVCMIWMRKVGGPLSEFFGYLALMWLGLSFIYIIDSVYNACMHI